MTSSIFFNRPTGGSSARETTASPSVSRLDKNEGAQQTKNPYDSVRVTLSQMARERFAAANKVASEMQAQVNEVREARKAQARQRIEEIKQRIQMLKTLMASLGDSAAKAVLREIRQLAGSLKQAAAILKEGSNGGSAINIGQVGTASATSEAASASASASASAAASAAAAAAAGGGTDATAAAAVSAAAVVSAPDAAEMEPASEGSADAESAAVPATTAAPAGGADEASDGASGTEGDETVAESATLRQEASAAVTERQREAQQRREDAKLVREAIQELKALLAMVKSALKRGDKEAQKDVEAIQGMIADSEKSAQALDAGGGIAASIGIDSAAGVSVDVSVGVQVAV